MTRVARSRPYALYALYAGNGPPPVSLPAEAEAVDQPAHASTRVFFEPSRTSFTVSPRL